MNNGHGIDTSCNQKVETNIRYGMAVNVKLTLNRSKSDAEKLILEFTISKVTSVPYTRLFISNVFLNTHALCNCTSSKGVDTMSKE